MLFYIQKGKMKANSFYQHVLIIVLLLSFLFSSARSAFASDIYTNDFTSSLDGFQNFFSSCTTSLDGLVCAGDSNEQFLSTFPNVTCVSADFTSPHGQADSLSLIDGVSTFADNFVSLRPSLNNHIEIDTANTSQGVATSPTITPSGKHNYMICKSGDDFDGFLDGTLVVSYTETGHNPISFLIGSSGGATRITNLKVTDELPSPTPTPTPTGTPTPTPFLENHLNVPLIKQTSDPWQKMEYDSAHIWAKFNKTIHDWGCVITDIAMVFQYHGIVRMPDNSLVNPDTINKWLKSQPDGYVGNGLVNWPAIARLSRLARDSGHNPIFASSYDALQYSRGDGDNDFNRETLTDDTEVLPDIVEEPGHFVVATGTTPNPTNTFYINDPYFSRSTLLDYGNTFISINRLIPTHTDLSYILLTGPQDVDFTLKTSSGSAVGQEFIQQPLQDPADPSQTSGDPIKMFYLQQPGNDTYTLTITSPNSEYNAKGYAYDTSGNVSTFNLTGTGNTSTPDTYSVDFVKTNAHQDTVTKQSIFDTIFQDIDSLYHSGDIQKSVRRKILDEVKDAQKQYAKHHYFQEKLQLTKLLLQMQFKKDYHVSNHAFSILSADITELLTH